MKKVLITCPPMLGVIDRFAEKFSEHDFQITAPTIRQTLSEQELIDLVPKHDGWIIGDDQVTESVLHAGKQGLLKGAVKWGIGVDNLDLAAFEKLEIPVTNTPNMFGAEVADLAMCYLTSCARDTFQIDRAVRSGHWPKPCGISLAEKKVAVIGLGDIGRNLVTRLKAADMIVVGYDPGITQLDDDAGLTLKRWPDGIDQVDFIVITCALTDSSFHLLNDKILSKVKYGVRIVNVARGPIIEEQALVRALESGKVHSAALDVFEDEPLRRDNKLRTFDNCIFGSHNASNTIEGVERTSVTAINKLAEMLRE